MHACAFADRSRVSPLRRRVGFPSKQTTDTFKHHITYTFEYNLQTSHLIPPHGGELINLILDREKRGRMKAHSREWPSWDLTPASFAISNCC